MPAPQLFSAGVCALIVLAGVAGYGLRVLQETRCTRLGVEEIPPLEYYVSNQSFCEIENAKTLLDALATRLLSELRAQSNPSVLKMGGRSGDIQVQLPCAIQQLERAIDKFKGTEQELMLVQELLVLLKYDRQDDRWLDVYLRVLYEHPTDRLIARSGRDALQISRALGRGPELARALIHLKEIPFEFPGKCYAAENASVLNSSPKEVGP